MSLFKFYLPVVIMVAFLTSWQDWGGFYTQDHNNRRSQTVSDCSVEDKAIEKYKQEISDLKIQLEREKAKYKRQSYDSKDNDEEEDYEFALMDEIVVKTSELEQCKNDSKLAESQLKECHRDCTSHVAKSYQECQHTLTTAQDDLTACRSDRTNFQDKYLSCQSSLMTCQGDYLKKENMMNEYVAKCKSDIEECRRKLTKDQH